VGKLAQLLLLRPDVPDDAVVDRFGLGHVAEQGGQREHRLAPLVHVEPGQPEPGDEDAARPLSNSLWIRSVSDVRPGALARSLARRSAGSTGG